MSLNRRRVVSCTRDKTKMTEEDTIERDEVTRKNGDALSALTAKHRLFIPQRDFARWRPTVPTSGTIDGFYDLGSLTCIATDGLQAWFLREGDLPPMIGHVHWFRWDVPVVRMVPYVKSTGEMGYFKSVKDCGTPSALFSKQAKPRQRTAASKKRTTASSKKKDFLATL